MIGGRAALLFGVLLISGMIVNLVMVRQDAAHLENLEVVEQPSAVGDTNYAPIPEQRSEGQVVATMRSQPLRVTSEGKMDSDDGSMIRTASDDRGYVLYRSIREKNGKLRYPGVLFLKVGQNKYLALKPAP